MKKIKPFFRKIFIEVGIIDPIKELQKQLEIEKKKNFDAFLSVSVQLVTLEVKKMKGEDVAEDDISRLRKVKKYLDVLTLQLGVELANIKLYLLRSKCYDDNETKEHLLQIRSEIDKKVREIVAFS
jgi:hypothetical protein